MTRASAYRISPTLIGAAVVLAAFGMKRGVKLRHQRPRALDAGVLGCGPRRRIAGARDQRVHHRASPNSHRHVGGPLCPWPSLLLSPPSRCSSGAVVGALARVLA